MEIRTRFLNHNNKLYKIKREIGAKYFLEENQVKLEWVKEFRDYLVCDHVLKVGETFVFCNEVTDVEYELV